MFASFNYLSSCYRSRTIIISNGSLKILIFSPSRISYWHTLFFTKAGAAKHSVYAMIKISTHIDSVFRHEEPFYYGKRLQQIEFCVSEV